LFPQNRKDHKNLTKEGISKMAKDKSKKKKITPTRPSCNITIDCKNGSHTVGGVGKYLLIAFTEEGDMSLLQSGIDSEDIATALTSYPDARIIAEEILLVTALYDQEANAIRAERLALQDYSPLGFSEEEIGTMIESAIEEYNQELAKDATNETPPPNPLPDDVFGSDAEDDEDDEE